MTFPGTIDYETLAQEAMRGVIRRILKQTEQSGLPGEHHFYISFNTQADGVNLSNRLRERYPEEMTIVLQHRFWDLAVGDDYFEVKLTFDSIPERLVVPFAAIKVFFDPSVRYALQFETPAFDTADDMRADEGFSADEIVTDDDDAPRRDAPHRLAPVAPAAVTPFVAADRRGAQRNDDASAARSGSQDNLSGTDAATETDEIAAADGDTDAGARGDQSQQRTESTDPNDTATGETAENEDNTDADADADESAVVVSLDAFRKK